MQVSYHTSAITVVLQGSSGKQQTAVVGMPLDEFGIVLLHGCLPVPQFVFVVPQNALVVPHFLRQSLFFQPTDIDLRIGPCVSRGALCVALGHTDIAGRS